MYVLAKLNLPAALNARPSWEGVTANFLKADHALSLLPAHFPGQASHQLPQVDGVVIQQ